MNRKPVIVEQKLMLGLEGILGNHDFSTLISE